MNENINLKRKSVAVNGDSSKKPAYFKTNPALYDMDQKLNLTSKILSNSEFALNCVQFINFISYYFEEMPSCQETLSMMFNHGQEAPAGDNKCPYKPKLLDAGKKSNPIVVSTCFPCIVCSSQFSFEQTFHLHLERRSILIRFYCLKCETYKTFYNSCKLLYHIYSHKLYLFEPIYKAIKIESITIDRLNLSKEKNIDLFKSSLSRMNNSTTVDLESFFMRPSRVQANDNGKELFWFRKINKMASHCPK